MKQDDNDELLWWVNILADPDTARLERLFPGGEWVAPKKLDLKDDDIVWPQKGPVRSVCPGAGFLQDFASLAERNASRKTIHRYAQEWGPLGLCRHLLPRSHGNALPMILNPRGYSLASPMRGPGPRYCWSPIKRGPKEYSEPLSAWRHYSAQAGAMLRVAAHLNSNEPAPLDEWASIYSPEGLLVFAPIRSGARMFETQQRMLTLAVNTWLEWGNVGVSWAWSGNERAFMLRCGSLFDALTVALLFAMNWTTGLAECSICRRAFTPSRAPAWGRGRNCDDCKAQGRDKKAAKHRFSTRKAKARELWKSEHSELEIRKAVPSRPATIAKWIREFEAAKAPASRVSPSAPTRRVQITPKRKAPKGGG